MATFRAEGKAKFIVVTSLESRKFRISHEGANEFKQAKSDVKMLTFLQLLLHLFMWSF